MEINGWRMFQHPLFKYQFERLLATAARTESANPKEFKNNKTVKFLARITTLITQEIPKDPAHDRFNQGNTLGQDYRHWKRAKFGRYRLFFRFDAKTQDRGKGKAIVYAWVNDERSLRKEGDKNDPYTIFTRGLDRGEPPNTFEELLKEAEQFDTEEQQAKE